MLAQLRIQNFLSFRDEQTLELAASTDRTLLAANTYQTQSKALPRLLRSLVLYGANGWGKTALIQAMRTARNLVLGEDAFLQPFALDDSHAQLPVSCSLDFFTSRGRCRCSFSLLTDGTGHRQVVEERLLSYTSRRPGLLCARTRTGDGEDIVIGPRLADKKARLVQDLGPDTLLTARCLQEKRLSDIRSWFAGLRFVADEDLTLPPASLSTRLAGDTALRQNILAFLDACGTGICDLVLATQADGVPEPAALMVRHHNQPGLLPFAALSDGTRKLITLLVHVFHTLDAGGILFLDNPQGLHPLVLRRLIQLFHDTNAARTAGQASQGSQSDAPALPAQLVLTTHDTSLMQTVGSMLRRDQIWFAERTEDQTSELFSLASFSPRKQEAIERRYFQGMYGALPAGTRA